MIRTFTTSSKAPRDGFPSAGPALDAWAVRFGEVQRKLHAALCKGRPWRGDLQTGFYGLFGFGSVHLDHVHRDLLAKRDAATAAAGFNADTTKVRIETKRKQIADKRKKLDRRKDDIDKAEHRLAVLTEKLNVKLVALRDAEDAALRLKTDAQATARDAARTERQILKAAAAATRTRD
jgi:hypothetical protein